MDNRRDVHLDKISDHQQSTVSGVFLSTCRRRNRMG